MVFIINVLYHHHRSLAFLYSRSSHRRVVDPQGSPGGESQCPVVLVFRRGHSHNRILHRRFLSFL